MPVFAEELNETLLRQGEPDLAVQNSDLAIYGRCSCKQADCATFYTAPKPEAAYPPSHFNVEAETATGMVILDVVDGRIVCVEVLHRQDVKQCLDAFDG